jgi:hypothetical protein
MNNFILVRNTSISIPIEISNPLIRETLYPLEEKKVSLGNHDGGVVFITIFRKASNLRLERDLRLWSGYVPVGNEKPIVVDPDFQHALVTHDNLVMPPICTDDEYIPLSSNENKNSRNIKLIVFLLITILLVIFLFFYLKQRR